MFSSRLPSALEPNAISKVASALRDAGVSLLDLTETNPSNVGLACAPDVLAELANPLAVRYSPEPLGMASAREAVARSYGGGGAVAPAVDPARVILTASTSEAYALLFKLLCDPIDEVLIPQPSYPLFDSLTALDAVVARPYRLDYHGTWSIDRASLERACTSRTRAVLVVSPNNPTGSILRAGDRDWLASFAADRDLAIIADEVFADYPLRPGRDAASLLGESRALTFVLGGLSKSAGLPQLKLGWIVVSGPAVLVDQAIERLEVICDTYLSVATPVQIAAPALIAAGVDLRDQIRARIAGNLAVAERLVAATPAVSLLPPEGGWSVVRRVPATQTEEALVLRLLQEAHVLVHPGFFFDFAGEAFLVVSLLPEPTRFEDGLSRVLAMAGGGQVA
jgi:aspartate/methionine/tyrosine aminotransferase